MAKKVFCISLFLSFFNNKNLELKIKTIKTKRNCMANVSDFDLFLISGFKARGTIGNCEIEEKQFKLNNT